MTWSNREIRQLLARLDRPQEMERLWLAQRLKLALGTPSARDAVLQVIDETFSTATKRDSDYRSIIRMADFHGEKRTLVASALHMSKRTFYRLRAIAIDLLAKAINERIRSGGPGQSFKFETARLISAVKPQAVAAIMEREAHRLRGEVAYEALQVAQHSGRSFSQSLLEQCTGHWRLLAELEIARSGLGGAGSSAYRKVRTAVADALYDLESSARVRVEFELAYIDRLDAIRRGDVDAAVRYTDALLNSSVDDVRLRAIATICHAEQVADDDLALADSTIREVQLLSPRLNDFRIAGRVAHAASIINLLSGNHVDARDLCGMTMAALDQTEPSFLPCAASIEGRSELLLGHDWEPADAIRRRFPDYWVTSMVDSVFARHVALANPRAALTIVERSAEFAKDRGAPGSMAYVAGTHAIVDELLGKRGEAQRRRIAAWENGVTLRDPFYTYDLLVHPALPERALGAFDLDEAFLAAIGRRLDLYLGDLVKTFGADRHDAIVDCLASSVELDAPSRRLLLRGRARRASPHRPLIGEGLLRSMNAFQRIAVEIGYCLPIERRQTFVARFSAAASELLGTSERRKTVS